MTELWMSHGKLVAAIAAKYRRSDIDHDDLINAGHLGLHTAIMRFDTERFDTRLAAYATVWIRWYITDYIRRNSGPVRLPESKAHRQLAQSGPRLLIEARKACEREGVEPTDSELHARIGRRVGLSADEVAHGLRLIQGARMSLHAQDDEDGYEVGLRDDAAPTADDLHERMDHERLRARIRMLANEVLGERERQVFLARSMADNDDVPSLEDVRRAVWRIRRADPSDRDQRPAQNRRRRWRRPAMPTPPATMSSRICRSPRPPRLVTECVRSAIAQGQGRGE